jgi:hypothetical protein
MAGFNWLAGPAPLGAFGLGAFSAGERAEIVQTGRFPAWWMRGGSAVAINNDPFLADGATGYSIDNALGGATVVAGRNTSSPIFGAADYKVEVTVAGSSHQYPRVQFNPVRFNVPNRRTLIRIWYQRVSGTQTTARLYYYNTGAAPFIQLDNFDGTVQFRQLETSYFSPSATSSPIVILQGNEVGEFRFVAQFIALGGITHPAPFRDTLMVADATVLGNVPGRIVGGTVISEEAPCTVPLSLDYTYTGTSINLLGGVILPAGTIWEVVSVTGENNDSVNLSLGTSTGGTQIVNAQATTAAPFRIGTYASQLINATSATGLWLTFSGNCAGRINVQLRKVK